MNTLDLTPLFRSTVGFDRLNNMFDSLLSNTREVSYPPYNIEKLSEDEYKITMAIAGFGESDIDITFQENLLTISGGADKADESIEKEYLHKGIAMRAFEHKFQLADHIRVVSAHMTNGLLEIGLEREVPEALKPQKIEIGTINHNVKKLAKESTKKVS